MSVYKHRNAKTYSYDFWVTLPSGERERFRGSTGEATERKAKQAEARLRAQAEAETQGLPTNIGKRLPDMPLREAFGRYWNEKAQFEANHKTVWGQLARMLEYFGADTPIGRITTDDLTRYQTDRRSKDGVSNRTINAEINELMRWVFTRAKLWKVDIGHEPIAWEALKLPIPKHRTRAASRAEKIRLLRALRLDFRPIVRFALLTGLRKKALILRWDQVDFEAGVLEYAKKSRHTGDKGWLPITPAMEKILRAQQGRDDHWVFTYVCRRSRQNRKKGERYPVTPAGLREAVEEAVKAAGLKDWRMIHDLRHTAATDTLRKSQNLKAVQGMLGHSDVAQTARYAHVLLDDIRKAMQ